MWSGVRSKVSAENHSYHWLQQVCIHLQSRFNFVVFVKVGMVVPYPNHKVITPHLLNKRHEHPNQYPVIN